MLWLRSILQKKRFWFLLSIGSLGILILSKYEPPDERLRHVRRWEIRQHRQMARLVEKQMHQIQTTPIQLKPSVSLEVLRGYLLQNKLGQLYRWSQENHQKKRQLSIHKVEYELGVGETYRIWKSTYHLDTRRLGDAEHKRYKALIAEMNTDPPEPRNSIVSHQVQAIYREHGTPYLIAAYRTILP